jgi:hypothetical protein
MFVYLYLVLNTCITHSKLCNVIFLFADVATMAASTITLNCAVSATGSPYIPIIDPDWLSPNLLSRTHAHVSKPCSNITKFPLLNTVFDKCPENRQARVIEFANRVYISVYHSRRV